jgi:hypothetical protein
MGTLHGASDVNGTRLHGSGTRLGRNHVRHLEQHHVD